MTDVTLEYVVELAEQLTPADQFALVEHLQLERYGPPLLDMGITLKEIKAIHAQRIADGAFEDVESLLNKYARPDLDLSFEEIESILRDAEVEWEQEIDEFHS